MCERDGVVEVKNICQLLKIEKQKIKLHFRSKNEKYSTINFTVTFFFYIIRKSSTALNFSYIFCFQNITYCSMCPVKFIKCVNSHTDALTNFSKKE